MTYKSYLSSIIISKVMAFDLSDADINQRTSEMSFIERILNIYAKLFSEAFGIIRELPSRCTFGTIQEGKKKLFIVLTS
jgi:hypothetical protein